MANHYVVQASGAMFSTNQPAGWAFVFAIFVTDQDGTPVQGLKKSSFSVWDVTTVSSITVTMVTELNADFPASSMPGIYRVQTYPILGIQSPAPQEFVFALRVGYKRGRTVLQGMTTVPVTYLGDAE
jgi:hypothetical protein